MDYQINWCDPKISPSICKSFFKTTSDPSKSWLHQKKKKKKLPHWRENGSNIGNQIKIYMQIQHISYTTLHITTDSKTKAIQIKNHEWKNRNSELTASTRVKNFFYGEMTASTEIKNFFFLSLSISQPYLFSLFHFL